MKSQNRVGLQRATGLLMFIGVILIVLYNFGLPWIYVNGQAESLASYGQSNVGYGIDIFLAAPILYGIGCFTPGFYSIRGKVYFTIDVAVVILGYFTLDNLMRESANGAVVIGWASATYLIGMLGLVASTVLLWITPHRGQRVGAAKPSSGS